MTEEQSKTFSVLESTSRRHNTLPGLPVELTCIVTELLPTRDALALAATTKHLYSVLNDVVYAQHIQTAPVSQQPLWWASRQDKRNLHALAAAKRALSHGAHPNARAELLPRHSEGHPTPLLQAIKNKNTALVQLLLSAGADPAAPGPPGQSPLGLAAEQLDLCILEILLASAPDATIRERWANIGIPTRLAGLHSPQNTHLLHIAAGKGSSAMVSLLLSCGANPDGPAGYLGPSPVFLSIQNGHPGVTEVLLDAGAHKSNSGTESMDFIVCWSLAGRLASGSSGMGADVEDEKQKAGLDCLRALLTKRTYPPDRLSLLISPWSTRPLTLFVFKMLFECGLYTQWRNHPAGHSILHDYAGLKAHRIPEDQDTIPEDFVKVLLDHGADVNAVYSKGCDRGFTPLMKAAKYGRTEMVELLLSRGADATMVDDLGMTAAEHINAKEANKERADAMINVLTKARQRAW